MQSHIREGKRIYIYICTRTNELFLITLYRGTRRLVMPLNVPLFNIRTIYDIVITNKYLIIVVFPVRCYNKLHLYNVHNFLVIVLP